jgi:hypothetical protein
LGVAPSCQLNQIRRVEGEQALDDAGPQPRGDPAAVTVQAKLVLEGPDDRLHPLAQPGREATWVGLVGTGGAQQDQLLAGQGGLDLVAGKPLSLTSTVPGTGVLAGRSSSRSSAWRSPASLGLARPNPVVVPSQVTTSSRLAPQEKRWWEVSRP